MERRIQKNIGVSLVGEFSDGSRGGTSGSLS
jgi:hypothetical protein